MGRDEREPDGLFPLAVVVPDREGQEAVAGTLFVPQGSVATSSPFSQTRRAGARLVGHIVDPRRGPLRTEVLAVAVWAPRGADADALATALVVAGPAAM